MRALWLLNPNLSEDDIIRLTKQQNEAHKEFLDIVKTQLDEIDDFDERMKHLGLAMQLQVLFFM